MTDQVLDIFKLALLALLYLFFARVLWAVWSEVRQPTNPRIVHPAPTPAPHAARGASSATLGKRTPKPPKGRRGQPGRLVIIEPKERKGTVFAIGPAGVAIGREQGNTVVIEGDAFVSGLHAKVSALADGGAVRVVVDDLGSKNGTYLNGVRLSGQQTVAAGDRIQVGYTVLEAQ
ncbi:MAG TPA: FHA domain-containing protein [Ilumatobacter sp.]|nr:FHA domain-containing protein [Ilumatobacter sp.]